MIWKVFYVLFQNDDVSKLNVASMFNIDIESVEEVNTYHYWIQH